jgi:predicted nuclease of predicted toxin-antitoxin system
MQFLVDMNLDVRVAEALRQRGHDVKHLRDEGLQRLPNGDIFAKAISEKRIILTCDLDFGEIAALSQGAVASIVLLRLRHVRFDHVMNRLDAVLPVASSDLNKGAIVIIEDARYRVRELPIGSS